MVLPDEAEHGGGIGMGTTGDGRRGSTNFTVRNKPNFHPAQTQLERMNVGRYPRLLHQRRQMSWGHGGLKMRPVCVLGFNDPRLGPLDGLVCAVLITQDCSRGIRIRSRVDEPSHWRSTDQYDTAKQAALERRQFVQGGGRIDGESASAEDTGQQKDGPRES